MLTYTQACTLRGYEEQCEMLLERLGRVIESYEARRDPLIVEGKKRRKKEKWKKTGKLCRRLWMRLRGGCVV